MKNPNGAALTILMPCLNEAETLGRCIAKAQTFLDRCGLDGEILIADNGSSDGSAEIAVAAGARVIKVARKGYGAALLAGIEAASGTFVIMGDADDSYDFSRLDGFVEALEAGHDLVIGNRFQGGIASGAMPFLHRYLGNPVLSWLGRLFYPSAIRDFHCGLRGFRRSAILALGLRAPGMEFASEMIVRATLGGLAIAEVPTTLSPDGRSRPPHLRTWRDGWRHLRFLLLHSPRWLFIYPGVFLLLAGMGLTAILMQGPLAILPGVVLQTHSLIVGCMAMLVGVSCLCFGLIAQTLGIARGILPPHPGLAGLGQKLGLERILMASGLVTALGLCGLGYAVLRWAAVDFGPLPGETLIPLMILSCTLVALGLQVAFAAFLRAIIDDGY
jgi:hypothetical protein